MSPCCPPCRAAPTVSLPSCGAPQLFQCCTAGDKGNNKAVHLSFTHLPFNLNLDHLKYLKMAVYYVPLQWPFSECILSRNTGATAALLAWKQSSSVWGSERFSEIFMTATFPDYLPCKAAGQHRLPKLLFCFLSAVIVVCFLYNS